LAHHIVLASVPASAVVERTAVPAVSQFNEMADAGTLTASVAPVAPVAPELSSIRDSLAALTLGERIDYLRELVQRQVKRVMRLRADTPPPGANDRLMSTGMDSLMAVDLRKLLTKELGGAVRLPSTLIFDYPTIGAIVTLILDSLDLGDKPELAAPMAAAPIVSAAPPATTHTTAASLAELSDAEVEAMLLNKLNGMLK
jgi:acyl carrier protein